MATGTISDTGPVTTETFVADATNSTSPVDTCATATDTNRRSPVFTGAPATDVTATDVTTNDVTTNDVTTTDVTTTDVSDDKPTTSAADVIINEESTNIAYTRQQKIILCSALIAEFFCFVFVVLPSPFLPKLVSTRFFILLKFRLF